MTAAATSESEHAALLAEVIDELRFLRQVKTFIMPPVDREIAVNVDSDEAIKMATNNFSSRRTRYIDVKHHIVRDTMDKGVVKIEYVKSGEPHVDASTKASDVETLGRHQGFPLSLHA